LWNRRDSSATQSHHPSRETPQDRGIFGIESGLLPDWRHRGARVDLFDDGKDLAVTRLDELRSFPIVRLKFRVAKGDFPNWLIRAA